MARVREILLPWDSQPQEAVEIEQTLRKVTDLGDSQRSIARQLEAEAQDMARQSAAMNTQRLQDAEDAEVVEILAMLL